MKWHKFTVKHQNNVPLNEIATYYLNQIKANNTKDLYFHPLGRSSNAVSNKFRLAVLQYLTACKGLYMASSEAERLKIATQSALQAGYSINEVPANDYNRKLYLLIIKAEIQQSFNFPLAA